MKVPVILKLEGRSMDPIQTDTAYIVAGAPPEAFGFYPTTMRDQTPY